MKELHKSNPKTLTDKEILNIIKEEFYELKPSGCIDFFNRRKRTPSRPYLRRRFNMTYNQLLLHAGIPESELNSIRKTKKELINELQSIAHRLGHSPSVKDLIKLGYCESVFKERFDSYNKALIAAGLSINEKPKKAKITNRKLLRLYINFSKELGRPATTKDINNSDSPYTATFFANRFGGFNQLRKLAGFPIISEYNKQYTKSQILNQLVDDYLKCNRTFTNKEINKNPSYPSIATILKYFKTTSMKVVWLEVTKEATNRLIKESEFIEYKSG